jgi:hypothetical protein
MVLCGSQVVVRRIEAQKGQYIHTLILIKPKKQ